MAKKKSSSKKNSKQDCPDGVCPIKKKTSTKKASAKSGKKNKDINVVVPIPAPIPISVPVTIPTDLKLIDRLKAIKNKVFSTFGFGPQ